MVMVVEGEGGRLMCRRASDKLQSTGDRNLIAENPDNVAWAGVVAGCNPNPVLCRSSGLWAMGFACCTSRSGVPARADPESFLA